MAGCAVEVSCKFFKKILFYGTTYKYFIFVMNKISNVKRPNLFTRLCPETSLSSRARKSKVQEDKTCGKQQVVGPRVRVFMTQLTDGLATICVELGDTTFTRVGITRSQAGRECGSVLCPRNCLSTASPLVWVWLVCCAVRWNWKCRKLGYFVYNSFWYEYILQFLFT
jgi:hypothetical protein